MPPCKDVIVSSLFYQIYLSSLFLQVCNCKIFLSFFFDAIVKFCNNFITTILLTFQRDNHRFKFLKALKTEKAEQQKAFDKPPGKSLSCTSCPSTDFFFHLREHLSFHSEGCIPHTAITSLIKIS